MKTINTQEMNKTIYYLIPLAFIGLAALMVYKNMPTFWIPVLFALVLVVFPPEEKK
jgi:hypothetical protein